MSDSPQASRFRAVAGSPPPKGHNLAAPPAVPLKYLCANCDEFFFPEGRPGPFCSRACKSRAGAVRAFRSAFSTYGRNSLPDDVRDALKIVMAQALSGGYDTKARYIPQATRTYVIPRDGGLCVMCGGAGTEIDHIDGPDPDPVNLRLLCHSCHVGVTMAHHRPIDSDSDTDEVFKQLTGRIDRETPERDCDGPQWATQWRLWAKTHAAPTSREHEL